MIHSFKYCKTKVGDLGKVVEVKDSVVKVKGFKGGGIGEGVTFEDNKKGMIESVVDDQALVMVFDRETVNLGLKAARTGRPLRVTVGQGVLGHTVSALGYLLDEDKQPSYDAEPEVIQSKVLGIDKRKRIKKQLLTGVGVTDLVLPLGEGQRELVIGDKKTGKTEWLLKVMLNQAKLGKICIYGLIGKRQSEINRIEEFLIKHEIDNKVILVAAPAGSSAGEVFLTPFTAMAMAEHFRDLGQDSLLILDDLTTHAKYFRELALLSGRFPGRESYPGEVFYTHAKLLERAGNFLINGKEVSITALPVAETQAGDLTGYIQTNLMSMTDGHLFFDESLFLQGIRPAVEIFLSVTRVGRQTQTQLMHKLSGEVVKRLKERQELERYLKFGAEMTEKVKKSLNQGDSLRKLFNQVGDKLYPLELTAILTGLILSERWDGEGIEDWLQQWEKDKQFRNKLTGIVRQAKDLDQFLKLLGGYETN